MRVLRGWCPSTITVSRSGVSSSILEALSAITYLTQDEWEPGPRLPHQQDLGGALQRGEKVGLERIPGVTRETLHLLVSRNVNDEAEAIDTDAWKGYITIQGDDSPTTR